MCTAATLTLPLITAATQRRSYITHATAMLNMAKSRTRLKNFLAQSNISKFPI